MDESVEDTDNAPEDVLPCGANRYRAARPRRNPAAKNLMVVIAMMVIPAAALWGMVYLLFGVRLAASIPLSYTVISSLSIYVFSRTKRYQFYRFSQLFMIVLLPFLLMVALGGFINSSAVIIWSLLCPMSALVFSGPR